MEKLPSFGSFGARNTSTFAKRKMSLDIKQILSMWKIICVCNHFSLSGPQMWCIFPLTTLNVFQKDSGTTQEGGGADETLISLRFVSISSYDNYTENTMTEEIPTLYEVEMNKSSNVHPIISARN